MAEIAKRVTPRTLRHCFATLLGTSAREENIMERTYASVAALVGRAAGPLASHLGHFVTWLIDQQYTASVIYVKARHAVAFDRWLAKRRVMVTDLGEAHIEQIPAPQPAWTTMYSY